MTGTIADPAPAGAGSVAVGGLPGTRARDHARRAARAGRAGGTLARVASGSLARWAEVYSQAAVSIARVGTAIGVALAILAVAGNVFTRNVLGYSLFGSDELARFAFLWAIWLGVSLAIKRGAVTVITFVADAGPGWWRGRCAPSPGSAWRSC